MSDVSAASQAEQIFRRARRRDWNVVWVCHALALGLTLLVLAGLCVPKDGDVPFVFFPHLFYWTVASAFSLSRVFMWGIMAGAVGGPIWLYRVVSYYRAGGTRALLLAGLRGRWLQQPRTERLQAALRYGFSTTSRLVRQGAPTLAFEPVEGAPFAPPKRFGSYLLLTLAISFNHWPALTAFEMALCVAPAWSVSLPSWAGPCTFGPARGEPSSLSPCRKLTVIP